MKRRWEIILLLGGLASWGCRATPPPAVSPPRSTASTASIATASGIVIHALRAGWVRVKASHRELSGPAFWRVPRIIFDEAWTAWMPIVVYAIVRPADGGIVLVDTGAAATINNPDYFDCESSHAWFYRRNLDFDVARGDHLLPRMVEAGLDPKRVDTIVVTHFHADHGGALDAFPTAQVLVGPGNWPSHAGAATCHLGANWAPLEARYEDGPFAGWAASRRLDQPGRIRMIPLPGHTPGHAGVAIEDEDQTWLFVGDATFDLGQTQRLAVAGISEDVTAAIATQRALRRAQRERRATLLPAHDPTVFQRLVASERNDSPR
ncbi:MAG: MBL fold metallo-hydrolase [Myxococcota bacterium]